MARDKIKLTAAVDGSKISRNMLGTWKAESRTELHSITKVNNFQTIVKNPKLLFQITDFKYLVVRYQYETHMTSYLQFWE